VDVLHELLESGADLAIVGLSLSLSLSLSPSL
jgi:hypothetical protein